MWWRSSVTKLCFAALFLAGILWASEWHWWVLANPFPLLFVLFYLVSASVLRFGSESFQVLYVALRRCFKPRTALPSPALSAKVHAQLKAQRRYCYSAGLAGFVIGAITIQFFAGQAEQIPNYQYAYAANMLPLWYAFVLAEFVLAPTLQAWRQGFRA